MIVWLLRDRGVNVYGCFTTPEKALAYVQSVRGTFDVTPVAVDDPMASCGATKFITQVDGVYRLTDVPPSLSYNHECSEVARAAMRGTDKPNQEHASDCPGNHPAYCNCGVTKKTW